MKHTIRKLRFWDIRNYMVHILTTTLNICKDNAKTLHNNLFVINVVANLCILFSWKYWFPGLLVFVPHRLSVVSNSIEGEGLVALAQSMNTNHTLSNIYIWGNKFDEATCVVSLFLD